MKEIFTKSDKFKQEYCASIVKIGELKPIEGSDFLAQTIVDGFSIVVRKDECKEGDIMFYCENETELNHDFLSANNLFEISSRELNKNFKEVDALVRDGKEDEAKRLVGFFNKHGRVKMIRLRGCPSMGFLFHLSSLLNWNNKLVGIDLETLVGTDFDTIDGVEFIKAYVPKVNMPSNGNGKHQKNRDKKLKRFDRMIDGEFHFHYDTNQLQKNMHHLQPDDEVTITDKIHGTSFIFGNIKVRKPRILKPQQKWYNNQINRQIRGIKKLYNINSKWVIENKIKPLFDKKIKSYSIGYGDVYSSRGQIKNQYINPGKKGYSKGLDASFDFYYELLKGKIDKGVTIYGEIAGYCEGSMTGIQTVGGKVYDYGCETGKSFLMPYRVSIKNEDGTTKELNVQEVYDWVIRFIKKYPMLSDRIKPIVILYKGKMKNLYPDLAIEEHWHENVLERMKNDKEHFGMEENEPLCKNKLPREGVVLRIENDMVNEAFKLKCISFLSKEGADIDKGIVDAEMAETNY